MQAVAVIDIGSNSIKVLVARRQADGQLTALLSKTLEARISAGISLATPRLSDEGMDCGVAAIRDLLADAATFSPAAVALVATSAVREAGNGAEFIRRVHAATGHTLRILSGDEEANLIGRGITCDPGLGELRDFYLFDLGGGSLECLSFRNRHIQQTVSLRLGCVRMTERCVADPAKPISTESLRRVGELTKEVLAKSGFHFDLPSDTVAIGTGGTITTARAILAAAEGKTLQEVNATLSVDQMRQLLERVHPLPLADRKLIPAMPVARADVLPAALATMIAVAETGGFGAFLHSLYNLRWGVAANMLAAPAST